MITDFNEAEWRDSVYELLFAINNTMGQPKVTKWRFNLKEEYLIKICEQLATNTYRPIEWFEPELDALSVRHIKKDPPVLHDDFMYRLLCLSAKDEMSSIASRQFDGIVYDDPFYALLACYNIGRRKKLYVLPTAYSRENAWQQRPVIIDTIKKNQYNPENYFTLCSPKGITSTGMPIKMLTISGAQLKKLQFEGSSVVSLDSNGGWFSIYQYMLPPDEK